MTDRITRYSSSRLMWMRALLLLPPIVVIACAQVLSYDDYRTREIDSGVPEVAIDTAPEAEVIVDTGPPPARVRARPTGVAMASGKGKTLWLGVHVYHLGTLDEKDWKLYGYDIDEVCTDEKASRENIGTCIRPKTAEQDSLTDGNLCRDNNFGRHVGVLVRTGMPDAEKSLNDAVHNGTSTWVLLIDDVDPDANDTYAPARLYRTI